MRSKKVLNLSGHPVKMNGVALIDAGAIVCDPATIMADAVRIILPYKGAIVDGQIRTIILPGFAPLTATILAIWHGWAGGFPRIIIPTRDDEGWKFETVLDLQTEREVARIRRR